MIISFFNIFICGSSQIFVEPSVLLVSLEVLTVDKAFNSLFDHLRIWVELGLENLGRLGDQVVVSESAS